MGRRKEGGRGWKELYEEHERTIWPLIIVIPIAILGIGYLVAPEAVWDGFIWRYYIAPIEADARDAPVDGITESYNPVDTTTYGIILVLALFAIYRLFQRLAIRPDRSFLFATIPYIFLGGVLRALEDAGMFTGKARYLFIAPVVYIFIGLVTVLKVVESHDMVKMDGRGGPDARRNALFLFAGIHAFWNCLYGIGYYMFINDREIFSADTPNVAYLLNPSISILLSVAAFLGVIVMMRRRGRLMFNDVYAIFGLHFLALAVLHAAVFAAAGGRFPGTAAAGSVDMNLHELAMVPLLAFCVTAIMVGLAHGLSRRWEWMTVFWRSKVNVALIYGHMLDAAATFTSLQYYSYGEKHVVPNLFIGLTGTPAVMFLLKGIVISIVIYVLDVELKDDLRRNRLLRMLVWVAILVLGLAPGTRDLVRLALGV